MKAFYLEMTTIPSTRECLPHINHRHTSTDSIQLDAARKWLDSIEEAVRHMLWTQA